MEQINNKKIFLVLDGNAVMHRAFHAMPQFMTFEGIPTGAVYGFFSMLLKLMQNLHPTHIAITFDRPKPTFRKLMYVGYQAQRPKMDDGLSRQFGMIHDLLDVIGIPIYEVDGFEADDVLGTIAYKVTHDEKDDRDTVFIVTGDRDIMQLVTSHVNVLAPYKGISEVMIMDEEKVREKFGVNPIQIIDLKALQGDASDNYPGVQGIGPKSAMNLVKEYGSVDAIYEHIDEIGVKNPKLAQKLIDGHDQAKLAQTLATIKTDVPFVFEYDKCNVKHFKRADFERAFEIYQFGSLIKRLDDVFGKTKTGKKVEEKKSGQMKLL